MKENVILFVVMILQAVAIMLQLCVYVHFGNLKKESGKMQTTTHETLKQMKLKYENYRKLDVFIPDVEAFINRYLYSEKIIYVEVSVILKIAGFLQLAVAALGIWQTFFSMERGIIIAFTMIVYYCICRLSDYTYAVNQAAINIREFLLKSDHVRMKEKREDRQYNRTENVYVQPESCEQECDREEVKEKASDESDDLSISEAAVYDMLSELFDL